ncbi:MAG: hypothetical protein CM15mP40_13800 [Alphaproteobacteria bacterium]|nr:MAG: hypothetical protein CM15mP40_13800 [Alphaproteobacteria bacterium]
MNFLKKDYSFHHWEMVSLQFHINFLNLRFSKASIIVLSDLYISISALRDSLVIDLRDKPVDKLSGKRMYHFLHFK